MTGHSGFCLTCRQVYNSATYDNEVWVGKASTIAHIGSGGLRAAVYFCGKKPAIGNSGFDGWNTAVNSGSYSASNGKAITP
jgi:hypothetical protein